MTDFSAALAPVVPYMPGNPAYTGAPPANPPLTGKLFGGSVAPETQRGGPFSGNEHSCVLSTSNDWFMNQVHMNPKVMDYGSIFGPKMLAMAILNTFRYEPRTLSSIDLSAVGAGVDITGGSTPAFTLEPFEDAVIEFTATPDGDPSFDGFAVFEWDHQNIAVRFLGTRLVPFTLEADMAGSIEESIGYVTNVMTAKRGDEQRVQLKKIPRFALEFSITAENERDAELLNTLIQAWQWRVYGVPLWQHAQRLLTPVSASDTTINVPTTTGYEYEVGGIVFLWRDPHTWEAVTITAVNATSVDCAPVASSWPIRQTLVMPMKLGRLSRREEITWVDVDMAQARLRFSMEATQL